VDVDEEKKVWTEEIRATGEELLAAVKKLIDEGNVRRITIKNEQGRVLIDIPLTLGVLGALLAPQLAAVGALAALVTNCTIIVERAED
jgi:hypothetical protein